MNSPALPDVLPQATDADSVLVRAVHGIESSSVAEGLGRVLALVSAPLGARGLKSVLLGAGTGHALHPALTDLPIGLWTSAVLLDLRGRQADRDAARLLLASGLVAALPTVATGLAEWRELSRPESRVGAVHAALNVGAVSLYAVSLGLRRRGRHSAGVAAGLAATTVATTAGYLGGHLAIARKAGSRHPAYDFDGVGPELSRPGAESPAAPKRPVDPER